MQAGTGWAGPPETSLPVCGWLSSPCVPMGSSLCACLCPDLKSCKAPVPVAQGSILTTPITSVKSLSPTK